MTPMTKKYLETFTIVKWSISKKLQMTAANIAAGALSPIHENSKKWRKMGNFEEYLRIYDQYCLTPQETIDQIKNCNRLLKIAVFANLANQSLHQIYGGNDENTQGPGIVSGTIRR
jgi:hypothetical protein